MPRRVRIPDRVIIHVRVPIPGLRALRPRGDDGIGLCESAQRRIEPARLEEIDSETGFLPLTCKFVVGVQIAEGKSCFAEGFVERGGGLDSARAGRDR